MKMHNSLLWLSGLLLVPNAFSFRYDAKDLKPYFSIGAEYRNMKVVDIDRMLFSTHGVYYNTEIWDDTEKKDNEGVLFSGDLGNHFQYFGSEDELINTDLGIINFGGDTRREAVTIGFEAGVFYQGMQFGFNVNIMQRQVSKPNSSTWSCGNCVEQATATEGQNTMVGWSTSLWSASYQVNDYEFIAGYELLPEASWLQIIPRFGMGWSVYNFQFPGAFGFYEDNSSDGNLKPYVMDQGDYSSVGMSFRFETEFRWTFFDRLGFGAFAGYRFSNFDQVYLGDDASSRYWYYGSPDMDADNLYLGGKIMIKLPSFYESESGKPVR